MASNRENLNTSFGNAQESAVSYTSLDVCPGCGGPADNGHDRCYPPSPYFCTACMAKEMSLPVTEQEDEAFERLMRLAGVHE